MFTRCYMLMKDTATAPVITVATGSSEPVSLEIPGVNSTPGTVAVLLKNVGSKEIIKSSVPTADGLVFALPDGSTVKIVDNSKDFRTSIPAIGLTTLPQPPADLERSQSDPCL